MTNTRVKKIWTAFVITFLRLLASLGLKTPAHQGGRQANSGLSTCGHRGSRLETPSHAPNGHESPAVPTRRPAVPPPDDGRTSVETYTPAVPAQRSSVRSLPPTIKQRIRAEAHGATPAARRLSPGWSDGSGDVSQLDTAADPSDAPSPTTAIPAPRPHERALCPV